MAAYTNTSGGMFVLPDGTEIPSGSTAEIGKDMVAVPGVAQFIEAGKLVEAEKPKPARAAKADSE